jgi:hypothetical protein
LSLGPAGAWLAHPAADVIFLKKFFDRPGKMGYKGIREKLHMSRTSEIWQNSV